MKVAIIRFSSLGDIILTTAVLEALFEKNIKPTFVTLEPFEILFKDDYRIEKVLSLNKSELKTIKQLKKFAKKLSDFDLIIDLHSNLRSFLISNFSGVKTVKYDKKSFQRRLLTKPIFKNFINLKDFNVVYAYLETLKHLNISNLEKYRPRVIINENDKPNINLPENFIVVGTGARYKGKMYPNYNEVIKILKKEGFNVVLLGSKEDIEKDKNNYEDVLDLRGKLNIREAMYVLSKAKLTISNDSAIAHMSRAVKTKVLMIYGATHPYFGFYPLEDEGDYLFANLPCQPCDLHGKKECKFKNYKCFEEIKPNLVVEKALSLL